MFKLFLTRPIHLPNKRLSCAQIGMRMVIVALVARCRSGVCERVVGVDVRERRQLPALALLVERRPAMRDRGVALVQHEEREVAVVVRSRDALRGESPCWDRVPLQLGCGTRATSATSVEIDKDTSRKNR